ncbi:MAG: hypothetical protein RL441_1464, partial [Actinomycetota bacterium]
MSSKKKQQNIYMDAAKRMAEFQASQTAVETNASRKSRDLSKALIGSAVAIVLALGAQWTYFSFGPQSSTTPITGVMDINGAKLDMTLDRADAPKAVGEFTKLIKKGFYKGISCHRLTTSGIFVLQCGDPKGDGTGGPGYSWGPIENAPKDNIYKSGVLAMARQGNNANSMGSQFFIVYQDSTIPADS